MSVREAKATVLAARGVTKSYGGVVALAGADLELRAGSAHALLGENGAGKSTLVKILAGSVTPDAGEITLDGGAIRFDNAAQAAARGVAVVSQELNLFEDLDILSNLFTMREPRRGPFIRRREMLRRARPVLAELGLRMDPQTPVRELALGERQLVEIGRALVTDPRVIILDEPTSALEAEGAENLVRILRVLREREVAVLFVSHILEEVMALCDRVTVLRDGRPTVSDAPIETLDVAAIVRAMLGDRRVAESAAPERTTVLRERVAEELSVAGADARSDLVMEAVSLRSRLFDFDLRVAAGEVVGLAGVAGAGHLAVLELLSGVRRASSGTISLPGIGRAPTSQRDAIRSGVALVTGDRRRLGLMLEKPLWENIAQVRAIGIAAAGPVLRAAELRSHARELAARLEIKASSVDMTAGQLSGGNQQKVVFAKWLDAGPSVLLLDDPSRGVDVGAKAEMHALIRAAADAGAIVVLCSTDGEEIAAVCDRVVVLRHGRFSEELSGASLDQHRLLQAINGS